MSKSHQPKRVPPLVSHISALLSLASTSVAVRNALLQFTGFLCCCCCCCFAVIQWQWQEECCLENILKMTKTRIILLVLFLLWNIEYVIFVFCFYKTVFHCFQASFLHAQRAVLRFIYSFFCEKINCGLNHKRLL